MRFQRLSIFLLEDHTNDRLITSEGVEFQPDIISLVLKRLWCHSQFEHYMTSNENFLNDTKC